MSEAIDLLEREVALLKKQLVAHDQRLLAWLPAQGNPGPVFAERATISDTIKHIEYTLAYLKKREKDERK